MSGEIRWLALLPDPVTGLDAPTCEAGSGKSMIWVAPDLAAARVQVKAALFPNQYRLCSVVSVVDWEARQREPQRSKLAHEPKSNRNQANQQCVVCRAPTGGAFSRFCNTHRQRGPKPKSQRHTWRDEP